MNVCGSYFPVVIARPRYAGLAGLKNGGLVDSAEARGFDVVITVDQEMPHRLDLAGRRMTLLILCGRTDQLRDLKPLIPAANSALDSIGRGDVVRIK